MHSVYHSNDANDHLKDLGKIIVKVQLDWVNSIIKSKVNYEWSTETRLTVVKIIQASSFLPFPTIDWLMNWFPFSYFYFLYSFARQNNSPSFLRNSLSQNVPKLSINKELRDGQNSKIYLQISHESFWLNIHTLHERMSPKRLLQAPLSWKKVCQD